ncbi:MAG TPA: ribosome recycling factor [Marinilabiliaceae bacterium]|nr:ribosome recycling factor [Marinilabiliaceae bacterium]
MEEEVQIVLEDASEMMAKALERLDREMDKVRAGRANPKMLESVMVDYYGAQTPISQVANINTPDPRTIAIQPWEKGLIPAIEKAIMAANLGMNPDNNGEIVRINVPPLTEERRKNLVKQVKKMGEDARISIRNIRRDANDTFKKFKKEGLPEDMEKASVDSMQKITDRFAAKIEEMLDKKEKDILTV